MKNTAIIEKVRQFNRFYAHFFGLYNNNFLESKFSLTEARVIFEIGRKNELTSKELAENLQLDPGYLSRIISKFEKKGYLEKNQCKTDARKQYVNLTQEGKNIRTQLDSITNHQIEKNLSGLSESEKKSLCEKMDSIKQILKDKINEK